MLDIHSIQFVSFHNASKEDREQLQHILYDDKEGSKNDLFEKFIPCKEFSPYRIDIVRSGQLHTKKEGLPIPSSVAAVAAVNASVNIDNLQYANAIVNFQYDNRPTTQPDLLDPYNMEWTMGQTWGPVYDNDNCTPYYPNFHMIGPNNQIMHNSQMPIFQPMQTNWTNSPFVQPVPGAFIQPGLLQYDHNHNHYFHGPPSPQQTYINFNRGGGDPCQPVIYHTYTDFSLPLRQPERTTQRASSEAANQAQPGSPKPGTVGIANEPRRNKLKKKYKKQRQLQRPVPTMRCNFCYKNSESFSVYSSHVLRDYNGNLSCPVLMMHICPLCGQTGVNAHTLRFCPWAKGSDCTFIHKGALASIGRKPSLDPDDV